MYSEAVKYQGVGCLILKQTTPLAFLRLIKYMAACLLMNGGLQNSTKKQSLSQKSAQNHKFLVASLRKMVKNKSMQTCWWPAGLSAMC